jgi:flagellar FliJ protein
MKQFRFRLQPLLRLRKQQEDQKKRVVGALLTQIHDLQRQALELAEAIKAEGETLKQQYVQGNVDLNWVAHYRRYVTSVQRAIAERIQTATNIQGKLHHARRELAEAARQTKILEKLKERQRKQYEREWQRKENRQLDEIGTKMFLRSGKTA